MLVIDEYFGVLIYLVPFIGFFFKYVFCLYHSILLDRKDHIFYPSFFLLALFIAPCSLFFTWYILYTVLANNFKRNLLSNPQILSWLQSCKAFFFFVTLITSIFSSNALPLLFDTTEHLGAEISSKTNSQNVFFPCIYRLFTNLHLWYEAHNYVLLVKWNIQDKRKILSLFIIQNIRGRRLVINDIWSKLNF